MNMQAAFNGTDTRPAVGVEDVTALIRRMGWTKVDHPNANLLVYLYKDSDTRGKPIKLALPAGNDYDDAAEKLASAVKLIAALSRHTVDQVHQMLLNRGSDILRHRLLANTKIFSLPLEIAPKAVGYLRDLVYYAACAEEDPQPFFEKGRKIGKDYTTRCRFGHTFPGSFGLTVEMPIPPNPNDLLIPDAQPAPFERRVMIRVMRGLQIASKGLREGDVSILTRDYAKGFNANLCEVMAGLTQDVRGFGSEFTMLWSPEYAIDEQLKNADPVRIDPDSFRPFFEAAAKSLRQAKESQQTTLHGLVIQLHADPGDDDAEEIEDRQIIVRFDLGALRAVKVHVSLTADDYRKACDAHKDSREVEIDGRPEKLGKFWNLTSPTNFRVVPLQN